MENQNETTDPQGGDLSQLKDMFADYQKKQTQSTSSNSRGNILAKYFVPRNTKEIFRILPPKPGRKHIGEAYFHPVTTNAAGGKKKHGTVIYCPARNDRKIPKLDTSGKPMVDESSGKAIMVPAPCPLCDKYKAELAKQDPSLKGIKKENMTPQQLETKVKNDAIYKEAIKWEAKKFYIVRGIDKGQEKDGVKFWRFKHNFKNQGVLDSLLPILQDYVAVNEVDFTDPLNGTDLSITMTEATFNNHVYKQVSAISARGKSPLHGDPIIAKTWLDDDITWRDVFKPKQAPGMPPYEFLEAVANGTSPYWDDTDANNKRWIFPGRPDLEEAANTRTRTFDNNNENFEQASDLQDDNTTPTVTVSNITAADVGTYKETAIDVGASALGETPVPPPAVTLGEDTQEESEPVTSGSELPEGDDFEDLPF